MGELCIKEASTKRNGPDQSGPWKDSGIESPLSRSVRLLLLLVGCGLFCGGLLCSFLGRVLHRSSLPNINDLRSQIAVVIHI